MLRKRALQAAVVGCAAAGTLLGASTAHASFIVVSTTADEYGAGAACGLREAIEAANTDGVFGGCSVADTDDDQIELAAGLTYVRTRTGAGEDLNSTGDFDVTAEPLVIVGHGATIQGTDTSAGDRLFHKSGSSLLHLVQVTLRDGFTAVTGGAALLEAGAIGITQSTVTSNHAGLHGGAFENSGGTAIFTNSTITGNTANGDGGGLDSDDAASNSIFDNATVTQNTADADAAAGPGRGGGVSIFRGTGTLRRTILAGNFDLTTAGFHPDCFVDAGGGPLGSGGYNLVGDDTGCGVLTNTGDIHNANAMLAPLASNGGGTQTHGLFPTSPAVDAGDPGVCNPVDQRNVMRPVGPRCDIGAFEGTVPLPPVASPPAPTSTATTAQPARRKKCKRKKRGRSAMAAKRKCKRKKRSGGSR